MKDGAIDFTWEISYPSGESDSWWMTGRLFRMSIDDLQPGMYTLTVTARTYETSGTFVILPSSDSGGDA